MEIPRETREAGAFSGAHRREDAVIVGVEVEPRLAHIARDVGQKKTDAEKKRLVARQSGELLAGPVGDFPIALVLIAVGKRAPIHEGIVAGGSGADEFGGRAGADATGVAHEVKLGRAKRGGQAVPDLTDGKGAVAVALKKLGQRRAVAPLGHRTDRGFEPVDAGGAGSQAHEQTRARRVAEWGLCVGVEKGGAAAREGVEVRRLRERMAAERSDPVVQIIDEDEEDVGFRRT
jgi:hypothetical protein